MTLANQMRRLHSDIATAKSQRLEEVAAIGPALQRQMEDGRASFRVAMDGLRKSIKTDLDGIFSEAAVIRGRAVDMMQQLTAEREANAKAWRTDLEAAVATLLGEYDRARKEYARARDELSVREMAAREAYLKDLRARVQKLLENAEKYLADLKADRVKAGNAWRQRTRVTGKPRPETQAKKTAKAPAESAEKAVAEKLAPKPAPDIAKTAAEPAAPSAERVTTAKPAAKSMEKTKIGKPATQPNPKKPQN